MTPQVRAFLDAIIAVYREHGLALDYDEGNGRFVIGPFVDTWDIRTLELARDETVPPVVIKPPPATPEQIAAFQAENKAAFDAFMARCKRPG